MKTNQRRKEVIVYFQVERKTVRISITRSLFLAGDFTGYPVLLSITSIHLHSHTYIVVGNGVKSYVSCSDATVQDVYDWCKVITVAVIHLKGWRKWDSRKAVSFSSDLVRAMHALRSGEAARRAKRGQPLPSRAISHARGHLRVSRFARRTTEKRETARSLQENHLAKCWTNSWWQTSDKDAMLEAKTIQFFFLFFFFWKICKKKKRFRLCSHYWQVKTVLGCVHTIGQ